MGARRVSEAPGAAAKRPVARLDDKDMAIIENNGGDDGNGDVAPAPPPAPSPPPAAHDDMDSDTADVDFDVNAYFN